MEPRAKNIGLLLSEYFENNGQEKLNITDRKLVENAYNQQISIEKIGSPGSSTNRFEHILMMFAQAVKWEKEGIKHKTTNRSLIREEKRKNNISRRNFKGAVDRHVLKKDLLQRGDLKFDLSSVSEADYNEDERLFFLGQLMTLCKEGNIKSKDSMKEFDIIIYLVVKLIESTKAEENY